MSENIFYDEHKRFKFDFTKAKRAVENDKCNEKKFNIKGFFLADFFVELDKSYIFIEFKNPQHPKTTDIERDKFYNEIIGANKKSKSDILEIAKDLSFKISCKFKDTFLLKWAEDITFDKPVHYIFILNAEIDPRHIITFTDRVQGYLPLNITKHQHIKKEIIKSFAILNIKEWNKEFTQLPITIVEGSRT